MAMLNAKVMAVGKGKVELETERLVLRGARPSDAEYLVEAFQDPEVMRYW